jgi:muramidase (phage lysozyme)
LSECGALDALSKGALESAICAANKTWASLPGSPYGQPVKTMSACISIFNERYAHYNLEKIKKIGSERT